MLATIDMHEVLTWPVVRELPPNGWVLVPETYTDSLPLHLLILGCWQDEDGWWMDSTAYIMMTVEDYGRARRNVRKWPKWEPGQVWMSEPIQFNIAWYRQWCDADQ